MIDSKEKRMLKQVRALSQELHVPMPLAFLTLEVFDKDGKLIQRHHQRSHSWVRNAYNILFCQLACAPPADAVYGAGLLNYKDIAGATKDGAITMLGIIRCDFDPIGYVKTEDGYLGAADEDDRGIIVGTGTNAESFEDTELQTLIGQGTGAGKLSYIMSEMSVVTYGALKMTQTIARFFNNNSGGAIGVNEVALASNLCIGNTSTNAITIRDKLGATVTVPDTGQLKVTYAIELTYPS